MTNQSEIVKSNTIINNTASGKYNIFCPISNNQILEEQFKSIDVSGEKDLLNKILSKNLTDNTDGITIEPHPFDYKLIEDLLKKFGLANAIIQKYCDNVIGKGVYIESEDEGLVEDMEKWMREAVFKPNLKGTFKEGLSKGSGFMEIAGFLNPGLTHSTKTVNSNTMYIQKDKYGTILKFIQFIGEDITRAKKEDLIEFDPSEMLHITINKIGSNLYGYGIIYSTLPTTNNFLLVQDSMHKLIKRKANNPIHVKMGNVEKNDWPTQNDIEGFGKNLTFMNESTEWVTGPNIEMNVLNFGALGEKFQSILDNDYKLLSYCYQVPETILGAGNIAEGLAGEQKESFLKTCQSLQEELEIALRTQIFDILAERFGKKDVEYKICFDTMTDSERNRRIIALKDLVGANVSSGLKREIERRISYLLDIDFDVVEEENEKQQALMPIVPNPNNPSGIPSKSEQPERDKQTTDNPQQDKQSIDKAEKDRMETSIIEIKEKINDYPISKLLKVVSDNSKGIYKNISHYITDKTDETLQTDVTIKEWVKTDYSGYKDAIIEHIKEDNFDDLRATSKTELRAGYLSDAQIEKLRDVFIEGFEHGNGIRGMSEKIKGNVDIGNLYEHTSRKLVKDEDGNNIILLDKNIRSDMIARTEVVRLTAEGAMIKMQKDGIETCKWVTAETERTCPECLALDGQIFEVANLDNSPPLHPNCACHVESVETQQEHFAKIRMILEEGKKLKLSPQEIEIKLSSVMNMPQNRLQKLVDSFLRLEVEEPKNILNEGGSNSGNWEGPGQPRIKQMDNSGSNNDKGNNLENSNPFKYQDNNQEQIIHDRQEPHWKYGESGSLDYKTKLENSGDVFRETSMHEDYVDSGYIKEKTIKIRNHIKDEVSGTIHPDDSFKTAKKLNPETFDKLDKLWKNQPTNNELQVHAKNLNIDMVNGNFDGVEKNIQLIEKQLIKRKSND